MENLNEELPPRPPSNVNPNISNEMWDNFLQIASFEKKIEFWNTHYHQTGKLEIGRTEDGRRIHLYPDPNQPKEVELYNSWAIKMVENELLPMSAKTYNDVFRFDILSLEELKQNFLNRYQLSTSKRNFVEFEKERIKKLFSSKKNAPLFKEEHYRIVLKQEELKLATPLHFMRHIPVYRRLAMRPYIHYLIYLGDVESNSKLKSQLEPSKKKGVTYSYNWEGKDEEIKELYELLKVKHIEKDTSYEDFYCIFRKEDTSTIKPIKWVSDNATELLFFILQLQSYNSIKNLKRTNYIQLKACFVKSDGAPFTEEFRILKQNIDINLSSSKQEEISRIVSTF